MDVEEVDYMVVTGLSQELGGTKTWIDTALGRGTLILEVSPYGLVPRVIDQRGGISAEG